MSDLITIKEALRLDIRDLQKENEEQARLLAMSADREEKLRAQFRRLLQHAKELSIRFEWCLKESNARLDDALEYRAQLHRARSRCLKLGRDRHLARKLADSAMLESDRLRAQLHKQ